MRGAGTAAGGILVRGMMEPRGGSDGVNIACRTRGRKVIVVGNAAGGVAWDISLLMLACTRELMTKEGSTLAADEDAERRLGMLKRFKFDIAAATELFWLRAKFPFILVILGAAAAVALPGCVRPFGNWVRLGADDGTLLATLATRPNPPYVGNGAVSMATITNHALADLLEPHATVDANLEAPRTAVPPPKTMEATFKPPSVTSAILILGDTFGSCIYLTNSRAVFCICFIPLDIFSTDMVY